MNILYRKKILCNILTINELERFIIDRNFYKFFKKFHSEYYPILIDKINSTKELSYKQIKPWIKDVLQYPETIYDSKFLYSMGWDYNEINEFISNKQKYNSSKLVEDKLNNPEKYYDKTTNRLEYWLKKGFSLEKSKELLKERQSTFSLNKCIEKYGDVDGLKKYNDRQKKWLDTLMKKSNYLDIQKSKNSYKNKTITDMINHTSFNEETKNLIKNNLTGNSLNDFVDIIIKNVDIKRYSDISPFFGSKLIQNYYGVSGDEIKQIFYKKNYINFKQQTYGISVYYNGIRFKSIKEYRIALFLDENNITYYYENKYPNSNFRYDFYLPDYDIYIEYYGMLDNKNFNNLNKIQIEYKNKMDEKNLYCEKNNLYLIQDINYDILITKLKNII